METIILRSRDEFDDLTLKPIKFDNSITLISGTKKDSKKKLLQCIGFDTGWNKMQANLWFKGFRSHADKIANLPDEAAGEWLRLYDEGILSGDDSDTAATKAWAKIKDKWIEDKDSNWHKFKAQWSDEITSSTNPIIEVFRAGEYPQGSFTIEDIDKMIKNYDPSIFQAPVTIDHSQVGPAQGWVQRIFRMGDSLYAVLENLITDFIKKVRNKEYRNRSIEIDEIEYKGQYIWPYFTAVTFLGSGEPQVKGMAEPVFVHSRSDHTMSMAFSIDRPKLIGFPVDVTDDSIRIRQKDPGLFEPDSFKTITLKGVDGVKAVIGKLKGEDTTTIQTYIFDKSKWTLEKAKAWVKEHGGKYSRDPNLFEDKGGTKLGDITLKQEEFDNKLKAEREAGKSEGIAAAKADAEKEAEKKFSAEKKELEDLKKENQTLKEVAAENRKAELQRFTESEYDRLLKAKKLIPAEKDYFFKMVEKLSADEEEIQFSEKEKLTPVKAFIKNLEASPDKIDTSKKTVDDDPNKKSFNTDRFKGTQFEYAPEIEKKRMIFVEEKLKEWKIEKGAANYREKEREAIKLARKEVTE